ncbi:MAG: hypothetical protein HFG27_00300 [Provencibacterium sp.]|jgi:hypothetical protein|nr:hypothetical protein [Provencibacterium sp.]
MSEYEKVVFDYAEKEEITKEEFESQKSALSKEDFARNYLEVKGGINSASRYYYLKTVNEQILISMLSSNLKDMRNWLNILYEKVNLISWIILIEFIVGILAAIVIFGILR